LVTWPRRARRESCARRSSTGFVGPVSVAQAVWPTVASPTRRPLLLVCCGGVRGRRVRDGPAHLGAPRHWGASDLPFLIAARSLASTPCWPCAALPEDAIPPDRTAAPTPRTPERRRGHECRSRSRPARRVDRVRSSRCFRFSACENGRFAPAAQNRFQPPQSSVPPGAVFAAIAGLLSCSCRRGLIHPVSGRLGERRQRVRPAVLQRPSAWRCSAVDGAWLHAVPPSGVGVRPGVTSRRQAPPGRDDLIRPSAAACWTTQRRFACRPAVVVLPASVILYTWAIPPCPTSWARCRGHRFSMGPASREPVVPGPGPHRLPGRLATTSELSGCAAGAAYCCIAGV